MNKYDFYKEIMSEYTLDMDKIKKNAERASSASFLARNSKWVPLTAAAAVIAFTFGGYLLFAPNIDDTLSDPPASGITEEMRLEAIENSAGIAERASMSRSIEKNVMYLTFDKPMTYKELDSILSLVASDTGVEIVALYNGGFVSIEEVLQNPGAFYNAAKVTAAASMFAELSERAEFLLVEFGDTVEGGVINDDNFRPFAALPATDNTPAAPTETTLPPGPIDNNPSINDIDDDNADVSDSPNDNPNTEPVNPDDMTEEPILEIPASDVLNVRFINESMFVLLAKNRLELYEISLNTDDAYDYVLIEVIETINPKVTYTDFKTGSLLIIGNNQAGKQTSLFMADGGSGSLRRLNVSGIMQSFDDISYAFFCCHEIVLKAQTDAGHNALYIAKSSDGYTFEKLEESADKLIILNQTDTGFIYAQVPADTGISAKLYYYNTAVGTAEELNPGIANPLSFERSPDVKNFAIITEAGVYIWNAELKALTDAPIDAADVKFHRHSGAVLCDDMNNWYLLEGTQVVSVSESEAEDSAAVTVFSRSYSVIEITEDLVIIGIEL